MGCAAASLGRERSWSSYFHLLRSYRPKVQYPRNAQQECHKQKSNSGCHITSLLRISQTLPNALPALRGRPNNPFALLLLILCAEVLRHDHKRCSRKFQLASTHPPNSPKEIGDSLFCGFQHRFLQRLSQILFSRIYKNDHIHWLFPRPPQPSRRIPVMDDAITQPVSILHNASHFTLVRLDNVGG